MSDFIFGHLPFAAVLGVCALLGYVLPSRVLTVEKARSGNGHRSGVWHWLRELLPFILVLLAALVGLVWVDPEGLGWDRMMSVAYFTCAGCCAMPAVSIARGMGYKIHLPGDRPKPKKYGIVNPPKQ